MGRRRDKIVEDAVAKLNEAKDLVEGLRDEYQEAIDNWDGTNLESTDRAQEYEDKVGELESIIDEIGSATDNLEGFES